MIFDAPTPFALLHHLKPDVLVKGGTYTVEQVVGKEVVEAYGGKVCVTGSRTGVSTTAILQSVGKKGPTHGESETAFQNASTAAVP